MNGWTAERRAKQAALIRSWQPWLHSTGAKTPEGKAVSSQNVLVGNANRAAALALATQELREAEAKVVKLSRGKIDPWVDRIVRGLKGVT